MILLSWIREERKGEKRDTLGHPKRYREAFIYSGNKQSFVKNKDFYSIEICFKNLLNNNNNNNNFKLQSEAPHPQQQLETKEAINPISRSCESSVVGNRKTKS